MLYIITSNAIPIKNIRDYNNNFLLSLLYQGVRIPSTNLDLVYYYTIFQQTKSDEIEDNSGNEFEFDFFEKPDITESLKLIAKFFQKQEEYFNSLDEDKRDEMIVISACPYNWNQQLVKYLNDELEELGTEVRCLNIFTHYKLPSMDRLTETLKVALNTNFIYPDDPVAFGYALYKAIGGMIL